MITMIKRLKLIFLGILIALLVFPAVNALGIMSVCLRENEIIYFSKCNSKIDDWTCEKTNCQLCVREISKGVYCPEDINSCNEACIYLYEQTPQNQTNQTDETLPQINLLNPLNKTNYTLNNLTNIKLEFSFSITKSSEAQSCSLIIND